MLGLNLSSQIDSANYYFNKAYNSSDYRLKIVNYTKCLRLNPDHAMAYYNIGNEKEKLGQYYCDDYKKACELGFKNTLGEI